MSSIALNDAAGALSAAQAAQAKHPNAALAYAMEGDAQMLAQRWDAAVGAVGGRDGE